MKKKLYILIFLIITIISLIVLLYYRYNLSFGNTAFQKSLMIGCMHKSLPKLNQSNSKKVCECLISNLIEKYSDKELESKSIDEIAENNKDLFVNCREIFKTKNSKKETKQTSDYFYFPDTIHKNVVVDTFSYHFKLPDTIIRGKNDYRFMKIYTQLFKTKSKCNKELNIKESDSSFTEAHNFSDTLNCPIYFKDKPKRGSYYIRGEVIIQSLATFYGAKDSTGSKLLTREFAFYKPIFIE